MNNKIGGLTQGMKKTLTKNCLICSKSFEKGINVSVRRWNTSVKYCSWECMWETKKGNKNRLGISYPAWNKGLPGRSGASNNMWKGGITPVAQSIRTSTKYKEWRKTVYERDNYTCQECGARNGNGKKVVLNADHINAFSLIMRKHGIDSVQSALVCADMWDIANGRTLCRPCHEKTPNFASRAKT